MSLVINPLNSDDARGKFGQIVYDRWKNLRTARQYKPPTQANSASQIIIRANLTTLSQAFNQLTDTQRGLWRWYALQNRGYNSIGKIFYPSNQNAFISLNMHRLLFELSQLDEPPITRPRCFIQILSDLSFTYPGEIAVHIEYLGTPDPNDYIEFYATYPGITPTHTPQSGEWKRCDHAHPIGNDFIIENIPLQPRSTWIQARYLDQFGQTTLFRKVYCTLS